MVKKTVIKNKNKNKNINTQSVKVVINEKTSKRRKRNYRPPKKQGDGGGSSSQSYTPEIHHTHTTLYVPAQHHIYHNQPVSSNPIANPPSNVSSNPLPPIIPPTPTIPTERKFTASRRFTTPIDVPPPFSPPRQSPILPEQIPTQRPIYETPRLENILKSPYSIESKSPDDLPPIIAEPKPSMQLRQRGRPHKIETDPIRIARQQRNRERYLAKKQQRRKQTENDNDL